MLEREDYETIISQFPDLDFAFSYGSGVIQQAGYDYSQSDSQKLPMCDFIFAVQDPIKWHTENLQRNPTHYSCFFDPKMLINMIQGPKSTGVAIWFNVEVALIIPNKPSRRMKYGVVQTSKLLEDLLRWDFLYLAGRLHKPVTIFSSPSNSTLHQKILQAIERNRIFALNVSLFLLPNQPSETDLYLQLAGLSYRGDPRLLFAENPNKVQNIVLPNLPTFQSIYRPLFSEESSLLSSFPSPLFSNSDPFPSHSPSLQSPDPSRFSTLNGFLNTFPTNFTKQLGSENSQKLHLHYLSLLKPHSDSNSTLSLKEREKIVGSALQRIVAWPALVQSAKGLFCVGTGKGGSYLISKIWKRFSK